MDDPRDTRIGELEAQLAKLVGLPARVAALERENATLHGENAHLQQENSALREQLAAAARRQAPSRPFARRKRLADPQKPGRKPGQDHFASRALPTPEQVTET